MLNIDSAKAHIHFIIVHGANFAFLLLPREQTTVHTREPERFPNCSTGGKNRSLLRPVKLVTRITELDSLMP